MRLGVADPMRLFLKHVDDVSANEVLFSHVARIEEEDEHGDYEQ